MRNGEDFSGTERETTTEQNPWEKMANEAPSFNPGQKETKMPNFSEKDLGEAILEQSSNRQDELVSWINGTRNGYGMNDTYHQAYDHFYENNITASEEDWLQSLEEELANLESRDNLLISALGDLELSINTNKSLEEVLNARADREQKNIDMLVQSGAWGNEWTDEQRNELLTRRNTYQDLAEQAKSVRNSLELNVDENKIFNETTTPEHHEAEDKPDTLYRGIKISYKDLPNFKFSGEDLVVNYEPMIDEQGRKTVKDGNEYGVYMSDNLSMVEYAYGNLHNDGTPVSKLRINYQQIAVPSIAVIYQIDTDGLDVREPFISDTLQGHYNNGFQGKEWIADTIPADHYDLYRVRIGEDILHSAKDINLQQTEDLSEQVHQELEARKKRLEIFADAMEKMSPAKRRMIDGDKLNILKTIYGENGLKYIDEDSLDTNDTSGMLKFLATKTFKQDEENIDFQTLKYIKGLEKRVEDIDSLVEVLQSDKQKNSQDKIAFEERKQRAGESYTTSRFDKEDERLDSLLSLVSSRTGKDGEQPITIINNKKSQTSPSKQTGVPIESTKANANDNKTTGLTEQDHTITNSRAETQAIVNTLENIRPELQQLFAMSRGSLSMEQAAGLLLIYNQQMINSVNAYAEISQDIQETEQAEKSTTTYRKQIDTEYSSSMNAINAIRQKTQILPIALKAPILTSCQNIENALQQIMSTVQNKNDEIHNISLEKQVVSSQESEDAFEEEMSM